MTQRTRDLAVLYGAAFLRALGVGLFGVVLAVFLARVGANATQIGLVIAAGLAGGTAATALLAIGADALGRRRTLVLLATLGAAGGLGLAYARSFPLLLLVAFIGMLNGMGTDRSATFALEQAIIPGLVANESRTWALSWYNVLLDGGAALGALGAALPALLRHWSGHDLAAAYRWIFLAYAAVQLLTAFLYLLISPRIEVVPSAGAFVPVSRETKSVVRRLASLFAIDALGGGFLADALVAYWFFRRFGIDEKELGVLFFAIHLLNAGSHLGAAWLARRIGLVNTMVFTHLPSSIFLLLVPFAPTFPLAAGLLLARESLVEMDVPTRQSYVAAVVAPHERIYASGVTNVTRTVAWAASSSVAGALMQNVVLAAPLLLGGSLKIFYDLLLYLGFRHLRPPEEQPNSTRPHVRAVQNG
jgi:MFS family permease